MQDPFNLQRFVDAQDPVFTQVTTELAAGEKLTHWMWFVFPQVAGLGTTETAKRFALGGIDEACAYLGHPVLGPRLEQCTRLVNALEGCSAEDIFGRIDALKFRSSMTLFATTAPELVLFRDALKKYCNGSADPKTLLLLKRSGH